MKVLIWPWPGKEVPGMHITAVLYLTIDILPDCPKLLEVDENSVNPQFTRKLSSLTLIVLLQVDR